MGGGTPEKRRFAVRRSLDGVTYTSSDAEAGMPDCDPVANATIGVQRENWVGLPPDVAVLVAPPVTVTARPVERPVNPLRKAQLSRSRGNMPVGRHRRLAG